MKESTKPHSKLGIASCVIGLITFLLFLMAVAVLLNWEESENILEMMLQHIVNWWF